MAAGPSGALSPDVEDARLLRHARHLLLPEIGVEGLERISAAHVLVVGAGGLGSPVALYLGAAGVGRLTVVDDDVVDLTNLQRQIAHGHRSIGRPKVESIRDAVAALNADVTVDAVRHRADAPWLDAAVPRADVVVDCSDNAATREALNAACVAHRRPLVSGAAIAFDGQLAVFDLRDEASPCYACVFPPGGERDDVRCATMGVFGPLVGIVGSVQAAEALKLLAGVGRSLAGRLVMVDARTMRCTDIAVPRDPHCPVCAGRPVAP